MKIEILYFRDCPHFVPARDRLKTVLRQEGLTDEVSEIEVKDASDAKALRFFGSPTIRINGLDIKVDSRNVVETGMACRRYPDGLPSEKMIRAAFLEVRKRHSGAGTAFASLVAIGRVLGASSCCLPLFPFMRAAGLAGGSAFSAARAVSIGVVRAAYRLRVLSSVARKKVPATYERDRVGPAVGLRGCGGDLDLFPSGDGERSGCGDGTVIV